VILVPGRSQLAVVALAGMAALVWQVQPAWAGTGGGLDPSFGAGGTVLADFDGPAMAYGEVIQPDGAIVTAGYASVAGNYDFALARHDRAGAPDPSFGAHGRVRTDIGAGSYDVGRAVALQSDGRIVVAGGSDAGGVAGFAVTRYDRHGALDTTFGVAGKVRTAIQGSAYAVAVQPDGRIVAAGGSDAGADGDFALVRYEPDGAVDTTFGQRGTVRTDLGGSDGVVAVAVQPDGAVVAVGTSTGAAGTDFAVARYRSDGSLDPSFGTGGTVRTDIGTGTDDYARAMALQPDGRIVVVGGSNAARGTDHDFALVRYTGDGRLDVGFGAGGRALTDFGGGNDDALAVTLQPDGGIVAAGAATVGNARFALARYRGDGTLDPSFGSAGTVTTDVGRGGHAAAFSLAWQSDGAIVAAGYARLDSFALARYLDRQGAPTR
jgi:uncharacterized delta-60 repeat protein